MYPTDFKPWLDCLNSIHQDDKIFDHYFTLERFCAKDVPEGCICFVPHGDEILLYYPMVKVHNVQLWSVFTTFSTFHDVESTPLNKYVYVLKLCFTENRVTPIFVDVDYGVYQDDILNYINNLKSPLL